MPVLCAQSFNFFYFLFLFFFSSVINLLPNKGEDQQLSFSYLKVKTFLALFNSGNIIHLIYLV